MYKIIERSNYEKIQTRWGGGTLTAPAFTLAEVLITLGIIGVVAAMTMPTLMNQTNGAQYKTAYKKALSALSQAVVLNVALDEYNFSDTENADKDGKGGDYTIYKIMTNRMNVVKTSDSGLGYTVQTPDASSGATAANFTGAQNYTLFFNDGIAFSFPKTAQKCTKDATKTGTVCKGIIDVNGQKAPNKVVKCDSGKRGGTGANACQVTNPTDIYPIIFYDQTILPNSDAARAVLYAKQFG